MQGAWFFSLVISFALPGIHALTLHQRDVSSVVTLDIQRRDIPNPVDRDRVRRKRDQTVGQRLDNEVCGCVLRFIAPDVQVLMH